jgi:sugar lactone lactonase YvrE
MRRLRTAALAAAALLLVACRASSPGDGRGGSTPPPAEPPAAATELCVSSDCGTRTVLLDIPGAENLLFTPEGRLFVSGSENVYEVTRDGDGTWQATPLSAAECNFTGLAQIGQTLYANCFDGQLFAATLTGTPALAPIHDLGIAAANGLADGPDGELYVVNGPLSPSALPDPKILRVDLDPADPLAVLAQIDWLLTGDLTFPNGIQRRGRTLYFTQSETLDAAPGKLMQVEVQADGSAGEPVGIGFFDTILDDFGLAGDRFLLTDYAGGRIALMNADGDIEQETLPLSFDNPSSVKLGRPPLFGERDLVITETGVVGFPPTPGYGNLLSVFTPDA